MKISQEFINTLIRKASVKTSDEKFEANLTKEEQAQIEASDDKESTLDLIKAEVMPEKCTKLVSLMVKL